MARALCTALLTSLSLSRFFLARGKAISRPVVHDTVRSTIRRFWTCGGMRYLSMACASAAFSSMARGLSLGWSGVVVSLK
jgi:hypothetical protein